jgi:hypothetical protein
MEDTTMKQPPPYGYSAERIADARAILRLNDSARAAIARMLTAPIVYSNEGFDRCQSLAALLTELDRDNVKRSANGLSL